MFGLFSRIKTIAVAVFASPARGLFQGRMFTQADGSTDLSRVLGALCLLTFLGYQGFALIVLKQAFDAGAFGTGLGAATAGVAVFILGHDRANH